MNDDERNELIDELGIGEATVPMCQRQKKKKLTKEEFVKRRVNRQTVVNRAKNPRAVKEQKYIRDQFILNCMNRCWPVDKIQEECLRRFNTQKDVTKSIISKIRLDRSDEFAEAKGKYKSEQVMRLQADLAKMRKANPIPWAAIARHEELLIRIVGTSEPVKTETNINVNVRESLLQVVQNLEENVIEGIIAEQLTLEAEAKQSRALLSQALVPNENEEKVEH
jgi:hypothetical protein